MKKIVSMLLCLSILEKLFICGESMSREMRTAIQGSAIMNCFSYSGEFIISQRFLKNFFICLSLSQS